MKNTLTKSLLALGAIAALGAGAGLTAIASAAGTTDTAAAVTTSTDTSANSASVSAPGAADATGTKPRGHMPLGQDGNVTAINGTTLTIQEESDEGGASYTVDASGATVTKDGVASSLSAITVGEKVFVQGTVSGTSVTATGVSIGHPGGHRGN